MAKVAILTHTDNGKIYEFRHLREELEALDFEVKHLQPDRFAATIGATLGLKYNGMPFDLPTLVLPRLGAGTGSHAALIIRQMQRMGAIVVNPIEAIEIARDKGYTMQVAAAAKLRVPETMIHAARETVVDAWDDRYPLIVKKTVGSRGVGVMPIYNRSQLSAITGMIKTDEQKGILIQEYIANRPGHDVRVICIGGKALPVGMMRIARDGEIRANTSRGGKGVAYPLTPKSIEISERVARLLGLEIAGIDLLFSGDDDYVLCEANSSPGFKAFDKACGISVAGKIAEYVAQRVNPRIA